MYTKNIIIGSQRKAKDGVKKVDSVAVYMPELSSENQVVSKFQTSLLAPEDYHNYMPVYMPTTEPLKEDIQGCCVKNRSYGTCCIWIGVTVIVMMLILLAAVIIFSVIH